MVLPPSRGECRTGIFSKTSLSFSRPKRWSCLASRPHNRASPSSRRHPLSSMAPATLHPDAAGARHPLPSPRRRRPQPDPLPTPPDPSPYLASRSLLPLVPSEVQLKLGLLANGGGAPVAVVHGGAPISVVVLDLSRRRCWMHVTAELRPPSSSRVHQGGAKIGTFPSGGGAPVVLVDGGVPSAVVVLDLSWWRWWRHGGAAITVLVLDLLLPPRDPPERIWCWICLLPELLLSP